MNKNIILISACLGQMQTNCYIAGNQETKEAYVFDPGADAPGIMKMISNAGLYLSGVLLTHGHFDHIMALPALLKEKENLPIFLGEDEKDVLENPQLNLTDMFGSSLSLKATDFVFDGQKLKLLGTTITCLHVPGHTKGSICYYFEEQGWLIAGDTLFKMSIGRTDFPTGDTDALLSGIQEKLFTLPDDTVVYAGHCPSTTIGEEKRSNPFFRSL